MEKLGLRLVPIENAPQIRKYYTSDLRYYVYFGQAKWKIVDLLIAEQGRLVVNYLPTIVGVKRYLRDLYAEN
jgi:hypothetical protein